MTRPYFGPFAYGAPHFSYYGHYRRFGFGRRLVWFGLGAFAAAAWMRHHSSYGHVLIEDEEGRRREWGWGGRSGFRSCEVQVVQSPQERVPVPPAAAMGGLHSAPTNQPLPQATPLDTPRDQMQGLPDRPVPVDHYSALPVPVEQHRPLDAGVRDLGRQASERVSDLSEATVDAMLAGLQGLKARFAERHAETPMPLPVRQQAPQPPAPRHLV